MPSGECTAWCSIGRERTGEGLGDLLLEVDDQLLGRPHEPSLLYRPRGDAALDALDEHPVLGADLAIERDELLDPRLVRVGREEVVEEAGRPRRRYRVHRPDRQVRPARQDVDREAREDEVELAPLDLAARVVAVRAVVAQRAEL